MCQLLRGLGLGTTQLWPQGLADGRRGQQQVEGAGWGDRPTLLHSPLRGKAEPPPHAGGLSKEDRRAREKEVGRGKGPSDERRVVLGAVICVACALTRGVADGALQFFLPRASPNKGEG